MIVTFYYICSINKYILIRTAADGIEKWQKKNE